MKAKKIYEHNTFKQGRNPLDSMGIGKKAWIDNWFKKYAPHVNYEIDDNYNISVNPLYLNRTNVSELPDNLTVYGFLDLENTNISRLPNNLTVHGSLDIEGTLISELPDDLNVRHEIYKDF